MKKFDIKELIERAKSIDLSEIDSDMIKEFVEDNKEIVISVGMVVAAIVGSFYFYNTQMEQISDLKKEVELIEEKMEPSKGLKSISAKVDKFIEEFPKSLTDQELINKVADLAGKHNIQINSFSSAEKERKSFYTMLTLTLNGITNDYLSLARFIHDIEYSDYSMRVNEFLVTPTFRDSEEVNGEVAEMEVSIEVAVLELKKDEKNKKK